MKWSRLMLASVFLVHFGAVTGICKVMAEREGSVITCTQVSEKISLRSTDRVPEASGAARVERRGGTTDIEVELESMKPASLFGGDYNTYVLWVVPPSGAAENAGEIALDGNRGKLHASTLAAAFAIIVTAEPHYLVSIPSAFVVLENKPDPNGQAIRYPVLEGLYNFERSNLSDTKDARGKVHSEMRQAFTAVRLAQRAGAPSLATEKFMEAKRALNQLLDLWHEGISRNKIDAQARATVQLAVAAQRLANDRAFHGTRVGAEGSGGGNGETGRRDLRGSDSFWR